MITRYRDNNLRRKEATKFGVMSKSGYPRLAVRKSNKYIEASFIDDLAKKTVGSTKGKDPVKLGTDIAKLGQKLKITKVSFDRGGYQYHGQVKAVAEAARAAGLIF